MKRCGCGLEFSAATFAALPLVGYIISETEEGEPFPAVLRNCSCGSTISIKAPKCATKAEFTAALKAAHAAGNNADYEGADLLWALTKETAP